MLANPFNYLFRVLLCAAMKELRGHTHKTEINLLIPIYLRTTLSNIIYDPSNPWSIFYHRIKDSSSLIEV